MASCKFESVLTISTSATQFPDLLISGPRLVRGWKLSRVCADTQPVMLYLLMLSMHPAAAEKFLCFLNMLSDGKKALCCYVITKVIFSAIPTITQNQGIYIKLAEIYGKGLIVNIESRR